MYRTLGSVAGITITVTTAPGRIWGTNTVTNITPVPTGIFQVNDLVVTANSAFAPGGTYIGTLQANHSSMKSMNTAQAILDRIKADFPVRNEP
jgi:hypothetical protein